MMKVGPTSFWIGVVVAYTVYIMGTVEEKIHTLLDKIRPYIEMHGGDVQLLRVEDDTAYLKVHGACVDCSLASVTYNKTVGPLIVKEVPEISNVEFESR